MGVLFDGCFSLELGGDLSADILSPQPSQPVYSSGKIACHFKINQSGRPENYPDDNDPLNQITREFKHGASKTRKHIGSCRSRNHYGSEVPRRHILQKRYGHRSSPGDSWECRGWLLVCGNIYVVCEDEERLEADQNPRGG